MAMDVPVLRIAQLNAGSLLEPGWAERRHEVVAWLRRLQADVVCLEEVWEDGTNENTAAWLVAAAGDLRYHHVFGGSPFDAALWPDQSMRFGSAVLSRWPIERSAYHRLPVIAGEEAFVDGVPWELLHARTAGLDVFACHLAPAPTHGLHRRRQVVAVDELIRAARGELDVFFGGRHHREAMPPILCGDFNAEPDSDEVRMLTGRAAVPEPGLVFRDAWTSPGNHGPGCTWVDANPFAAAEHEQERRIDYVFTGWRRNDGRGAPLSCQVVGDAPVEGVWPSDHLGVLAELRA
jgi:endonuclease/exonuclease/phosphatase family metal-dependent hydrolase